MLCYGMFCYVMLCYVTFYIILYYILYIISYLSYTILYYYNLMAPPSYMWSVVDRNVVMRRIPVHVDGATVMLLFTVEN